MKTYTQKLKILQILPPIRGRTNDGFVFYKVQLWWERRMAKSADEEALKTLVHFKNNKKTADD